MAVPMDVRLFGELEVAVAGAPVAVRGARQRALLAMLALRPGEAVSADRLIDGLWGEDLPLHPANALQAQVAQLRRSLGADAVVTTEVGYALRVEADDVDVIRFERLVARGAPLVDDDPVAAARILAEALALHRGELLAEFAFAGFADNERVRLEELALSATEQRIIAELGTGRHDSVVAELEVLCREHPLRERLWELRMLALYRAGRQADALRAFSEARGHLVEELGIEPGPRLRELERRILEQDAALGASAPAPGRAAADPLPARDEAPTRSPTRAREQHGNLRESLTSFVGRQAERDAVLDALRTGRLVTIVGPGGAGKTRLATEAAAAAQPEHRDGAWLVELAGVGPGDVAGAVAVVTGAGEAARVAREPVRSPLDLVVRYSRDRSMLLVLDNCEHVVADAATLAETLLGAAPDVHVLATSREALGVPGEVLIPLRGLALDAAVELFADRARAVQPAFVLDDDVRAVVADVAARIDGLPLAVELAAARLRALPLRTLADRLDDRFKVLNAGARTAMPRQQTLRAVVDWSYDLLFDDERRLFNRLSVFVGGCDLAAVEAVCADDQLPADDVVDILGRLIDKSLIVADMGTGRYSQLQTLWQYASERLAEGGETEPFRERHARWYLDVARGARDGLRGATGPQWKAQLDDDLANLRAALDWFVGHADAEAALATAYGTAWLWFLRSDSHEGLRWLSDALATAGDAPLGLRAVCRAWHAYYAATLTGPAGALDESRQAVEEARVSGEVEPLGDALVLLAEVLNRTGQLEEAQAALDEAEPLLEQVGNQWALAVHDMLAAGNLAPLGRIDEAETLARRSVDRFNQLGERWLITEGRGLLAGIAEARGDLERAVAAYEELLDNAEFGGAGHYETLWLPRLAALRARMGDDEAAERTFAAAIARSRRPTNTATALVGRAGAARRLGRHDEARGWLDEAFRIYERLQLPAGGAAAHVGQAWLELAEGDVVAARHHAEQAAHQAAGVADGLTALSVDTVVAAVDVADADTEASRAAFIEILDRRAVSGAGRFAAMFGGAFASTFDEPDVAAFADRLSLRPRPHTGVEAAASRQ